MKVLYPVWWALYCFICLVTVLYHRLNSTIWFLYDTFVYSEPSIQNIQKEGLNCGKLPNHIAVVLDEKNILKSELIKAICYLIACNIPYITIYEATGMVKSQTESFRKLITNNSYLKISNIEIKDNVLSGDWAFNDKDKDEKQQFTLNIISFNECKQNISKCAKEIISDRKLNNINSPITINEFDQYLHKAYGISSDPDLIIKFDDCSIMAGYDPWRITVGAILDAGSLKRFRWRTMKSVFSCYANSTQRYGK
eukprot:TRINITY_DN20986_c0_g1_i1.p1 TRINITY_DN20986_c0_g1~~TRINITY_DN20986_c0_g1_i1.p1  ORF type:complete len:253 (-),score=34.30 TRINITY_DN20986_c0_g1_i1:5-763(-)